jgi:hypothetical protein
MKLVCGTHTCAHIAQEWAPTAPSQILGLAGLGQVFQFADFVFVRLEVSGGYVFF